MFLIRTTAMAQKCCLKVVNQCLMYFLISSFDIVRQLFKLFKSHTENKYYAIK